MFIVSWSAWWQPAKVFTVSAYNVKLRLSCQVVGLVSSKLKDPSTLVTYLGTIVDRSTIQRLILFTINQLFLVFMLPILTILGTYDVHDQTVFNCKTMLFRIVIKSN